ncbi:uncharacterized protein LOC132592812 isoform X2 [Zootoca vivipara]|nr:uncharacterized protein LOC132591696 isoform X3 [Zootoca vivipara]XP_060133684.1 uncharacterized protein LOC132592538 isoform X2 [Zootoca vivipara]XP_060136364.1 uncharacterized protein LOC132592812 isoform X2 [Zootoca vivipara]
MATILELPETTTSGPADSSDDDFVGPSGVLMPNASSTPMVVPAPPPVKRRSEGKQPRRTRRARQAKGRVSGQGQGGRTGASSNVVVSPVAPSQTLAVASRREGLSSASGEEALPVPARASSGGKRRHKSRSRRRAKRRKDDTSASTTSGSSSSSEGSDHSMGLYWAYGEVDSGLPRWAWARRANSHRARYGAVQECLDGELVPETTVSTNSTRDIIPGSHLSSKLRSRILDGKYVDIFDLAPPEEVVPEQGNALVGTKKKGRGRKVERTFERWLDCYQVFSGVVVAAYPRRALHLIVYQSIVRSAYNMAGEAAAIAYDERFRRRASKIDTARFDRKDLDLWTTYVAPSVSRKPAEQQRAKTQPFKAAPKLRCWDFNKGLCQRPRCIYAHTCDRCGGSHPAVNCYAGRRPFRGGRGGFRQAPRGSAPALPAPPAASTSK